MGIPRPWPFITGTKPAFHSVKTTHTEGVEEKRNGEKKDRAKLDELRADAQGRGDPQYWALVFDNYATHNNNVYSRGWGGQKDEVSGKEHTC